MEQASFFDYQDHPLIRVYMTPKLRDHRTYTKALYQLSTASRLTGVTEPVIGMPDLTAAYGLPVGGILATEAETGVISLNAIGGDINCGISLSQLDLPKDHFFPSEGLDRTNCRTLSELIKRILTEPLEKVDYDAIFFSGAGALCGSEEVNKIENYGVLPIGNPRRVDKNMRLAAEKSLGSLGRGNHFIDLLYCEEIFDVELSLLWGLNQNQVQLMVHTGSRGVGNYIREKYSLHNDNDSLVSRVFQPRIFDSADGQEILDAVNLASNFAYANRADLRRKITFSLSRFTGRDLKQDLIYDFGHNGISLEYMNGKEIVLHRKGASRGLPPNHPKNTGYYLGTGHPIIIPGSLGTATYVLVGTEKLEETYYSINHGSGRKYTRGYVKSKKHHPRFKQKIDSIFVNLKPKDYCEEVPNAYKDIDEVVKTLEVNGFVRKVAKLQPFFVYLEKED